MKEEICEECGAIIGIDEQAYVYKGRVVCGQCHRKLSRQAQHDKQLQDTWKLEEFTPLPQTEELEELLEPEQLKESKPPLDSLGKKEPEEFTALPETEELHEAIVPEEVEELKEPEEMPQPQLTPQVQESEEAFESIEPQETEEFSEFQEFEFFEEPKADEQVTESQELIEPLDSGVTKDFAEFHEFEQPPEPKEHQEVTESGKLFKTLRMDKPEEFEEFAGSEEIEEYKKPEKLRELIEPPAGPFVAEQVASVRLPGRRRRIKRTRSTLLCFLLTAWSLLCLFLLFYVPGRYADLLRDTAFCKRYQLGGFAPDCLILSLMIVWFFGALLLFVIVTSLQKDRHRAGR